MRHHHKDYEVWREEFRCEFETVASFDTLRDAIRDMRRRGAHHRVVVWELVDQWTKYPRSLANSETIDNSV